MAPADDETPYLQDLVALCDRFVPELKAAIGDPMKERAVITRGVESYKKARRSHGIKPEDEGIAHFFLSDGVFGDDSVESRDPPISLLGLDKQETARINDLFLDLLGI